MIASAEKTRVVKMEPLGLVLERVFDAPRRLVFAAFSEREHLLRWWGPKGIALGALDLDFRAGGRFRFVMDAPDGKKYPFDGSFDEIVPLERIVFTGEIHDGNHVVTTITFADDGATKTRVVVSQTYTIASDATRGATQGWSESFEKLDALLG